MIPRDVVETVALVALFVISGGLCVLLGYALGRMRGEDDARTETAHAVLRGDPRPVSPAPEPTTITSRWPWGTPCSKCGGEMVQAFRHRACLACRHAEHEELSA